MMRRGSWRSRHCKIHHSNSSRCWTMLTVWNNCSFYSYCLFREESILTEKRYFWRRRSSRWAIDWEGTAAETPRQQIRRLTQQSKPYFLSYFPLDHESVSVDSQFWTATAARDGGTQGLEQREQSALHGESNSDIQPVAHAGEYWQLAVSSQWTQDQSAAAVERLWNDWEG